LNKKKFVSKNAILDKIGDVKFYLRQYYCKTCHTYPKIKLESIVSDYEKISKDFKGKLVRKAKTGRKSLRKTNKDYKEDNISISHQTIHNILNIGNKKELTFKTLDLTGYFEFNERHLTTKNNKKFKG
jgi:predicted nucleic-acid-binding Zn-ribbon protein